MEGLVKIKNE